MSALTDSLLAKLKAFVAQPTTYLTVVITAAVAFVAGLVL